MRYEVYVFVKGKRDTFCPKIKCLLVLVMSNEKWKREGQNLNGYRKLQKVCGEKIFSVARSKMTKMKWIYL